MMRCRIPPENWCGCAAMAPAGSLISNPFQHAQDHLSTRGGVEAAVQREPLVQLLSDQHGWIERRHGFLKHQAHA